MAKKNNNQDIEDVQVPRELTVDELKEKLSFFQNLDGDYGLFYALNYQKNNLAKQLSNTVIDIKGEDKTFANFLNLSKEIRNLAETTDWLKQKLKLTDEDIDNEVKKQLSPLEERALKSSYSK